MTIEWWGESFQLSRQNQQLFIVLKTYRIKMSKFFNIPSMITNALSKAPDPNKVQEINSNVYNQWPVSRREDCLLLYGPHINEKSGASGSVGFKNGGDSDKVENVGSYEIVVQSDRNIKYCYSVFRSCNVNEVNQRFEQYKKILPHYLTARQELCCTGSLQKLCDSIKDHPDWGLCHLAVHLDMIDLVAQEDRFRVELDHVDTAGVTAIMVAVNSGSKHLVAGLVSQGASLSQGCDVTGSNVMHYVAVKSVSILDIISGGEKYKSDDIVKLLNTRNSSNQTPLHIACEEDKPDMVRAMLSLGADYNILANMSTTSDGDNPDTDQPQKKLKSDSDTSFKDIILQHPNGLYTKDIKLGGTPLHWTQEKPMMEALINLGCDIEARNSVGNTALHVMLSHQRLSCVVCLLSHGADVNSPDAAGLTPLHLAVEKGHLPSIQALLVFGADFNLKNKSGDTPWILALKTHQAKFSFKDVEKERNMILHTLHSIGAQGPSELLTPAKEFDWKPPVTDKNRLHLRCRHLFDEFLDTGAAYADIKPGSARILSLDGGGIKGLVLAKLLECLCEVSGSKVTEMFDWITGTSTGGILCLALAVGMTPLQCQSLYFKLKDNVFVGKRPYAVEPMEEFLKKEFTETLMMTDLPEKPFIAVTGTLADRYPADLHFFRNYTSPMDILGVKEDLLSSMSPIKKPDQQTVWRAARSSGAAPTYFRAMGRFIDGGLIANNPTLDIMTEVHERNCALKSVGRGADAKDIGVVVSLGTGDPPVEKVDCIDLFIPDSIMNLPQLYMGMSAMGRLMVDQASSSLNRVVDRARAWCSMAGISYYRLSPMLASDISLDETNDEILVEMLWMTQSYMYEKREKIKDLVKILQKSSTSK